MIRHRSLNISMLVTMMIFYSCTGLKNISSGDPLYTGARLEYTDHKPESRHTYKQLQLAPKPRPNKKLFWMRPALARHNMLDSAARKKKFWSKRIEEPVRLSDVSPASIAEVIRNRLFHKGYFKVESEFEIKRSKRTTKIKYKVTLNKPFRIRNIEYPEVTDSLSAAIRASTDEMVLQKGDIYDLQKIREERVRIDEFLKNTGYYYFNTDFLLFEADTTIGDHQVDLYLRVKNTTPQQARKSYTIDKVYIHADHALDQYNPDTTLYKDYHIISQREKVRPQAILDGVFLEPGKLYSQLDHSMTIRHLTSLPIFRFANVKISQSENSEKLNGSIFLNQRKRFTYSAELNAILRSTNYLGPGVILSYRDRNFNGGAEELRLDLRGRFDFQITDSVINPAYEVGLDAQYIIPRLYPSILKKISGYSIPKTTIKVGYNLFNRFDLYRMNAIFTEFGYQWSRRNQLTQALNPFEFIFTRIPDASMSDKFINYLENNPGVSRSFNEQFILGTAYNATYSSPSGQVHDFFVNTGIDASGNLLYGLSRILKGPSDSQEPYSFFNLPFSQYIRARADLRYGFHMSKNSELATRLVAGVGYPYGNSRILPYIKQFYVGGTNSLRSFIARSVGPGSEAPPEGYTDLTGDIKIEGNAELRFSLSPKLKGALFIDAGNIWLVNEDPDRPNGSFNAETFLNELAVSGGWGARWDIDFVVFRLDFAYTLRTPYLPAGERWASEINFLKPVLNLAIGYPF